MQTNQAALPALDDLEDFIGGGVEAVGRGKQKTCFRRAARRADAPDSEGRVGRSEVLRENAGFSHSRVHKHRRTHLASHGPGRWRMGPPRRKAAKLDPSAQERKRPSIEILF